MCQVTPWMLPVLCNPVLLGAWSDYLLLSWFIHHAFPLRRVAKISSIIKNKICQRAGEFFIRITVIYHRRGFGKVPGLLSRRVEVVKVSNKEKENYIIHAVWYHPIMLTGSSSSECNWHRATSFFTLNFSCTGFALYHKIFLHAKWLAKKVIIIIENS